MKMLEVGLDVLVLVFYVSVGLKKEVLRSWFRKGVIFLECGLGTIYLKKLFGDVC